MSNKVFEGVQRNVSLDQGQRHQFSKCLGSVVWTVKVDDSATTKDEVHAFVAGVCISPMGYILTSSHVIQPELKYVGSCPSWRKGWTSLKIVKRSLAYGLCVLQLEGMGRKKTEYASLDQSGCLNVNQHVYGFGHSNMFQIPCTNMFVRGSVEYPCGDIENLPACPNDVGNSAAKCFEDIEKTVQPKFDIEESILSAYRTVKDLSCVIDAATFTPKTIFLMHKDIPMIQIKNFHLGHCGGPVFVSSGHLIGVVLFKFNEINFAVHLSAIKEFLKDVDFTMSMSTATESVAEIPMQVKQYAAKLEEQVQKSASDFKEN